MAMLNLELLLKMGSKKRAKNVCAKACQKRVHKSAPKMGTKKRAKMCAQKRAKNKF